MYNKFQVFQNKWLADNVKENQSQQCNNWLLGKSDPSSTTTSNQTIKPFIITTNEDLEKTPYRKFNKYEVH